MYFARRKDIRLSFNTLQGDAQRVPASDILFGESGL